MVRGDLLESVFGVVFFGIPGWERYCRSMGKNRGTGSPGDYINVLPVGMTDEPIDYFSFFMVLY